MTQCSCKKLMGILRKLPDVGVVFVHGQKGAGKVSERVEMTATSKSPCILCSENLWLSGKVGRICNFLIG